MVADSRLRRVAVVALTMSTTTADHTRASTGKLVASTLQLIIV